jgi:hypothetical protein
VAASLRLWTAIGINYALVVDGTDAEFFIDGVSRATRSGFSIGEANPTLLGSQFGGNNELFNGSLRDVRIYDNPLTSSQVVAIANGTEGVPEPGTDVLFGSALLTVGLVWRRRRAATETRTRKRAGCGCLMNRLRKAIRMECAVVGGSAAEY